MKTKEMLLIHLRTQNKLLIFDYSVTYSAGFRYQYADKSTFFYTDIFITHLGQGSFYPAFIFSIAMDGSQPR